MHSINVHVLGAVLLGLWFAQWVVMFVAPGGFPRGGKPNSVVARAYNMLNMCIIVFVMPGVALLLVTGYTAPLGGTRIPVPDGVGLRAAELMGLALFVSGNALLTWARFSIGRSFQMGGVAPRYDDQLARSGVYRHLRHPMYTALVCFNGGLTLLTQSVVLLVLFLGLVAVIVRLIPIEERQLATAYRADYAAYRRTTWALVPFLY